MRESERHDESPKLLQVPTDRPRELVAALTDALAGAPIAVQPVPPEGAPRPPGPLDARTALIIHTSGSTGVPKFVALSADALRANALATEDALGGAGQWLVVLPTHLIAGVQILVRSIVAGTRAVELDGRFSPEAFVAAANRLDAALRFTSLVPVQLSRLLDAAEVDDETLRVLRRFDAVLVGGQAVPLSLRTRAHELGLRIRRTYGMTETAGGVVYDGVEIGETRVRIRGGEIHIGGPSLALGYVADDELTRDRFINEGGERWFRTGDAGTLVGGMLTVTGRIDRVIISGGVNVSLDEVERVMHADASWARAVAIRTEDPEWGERVVIVTEGSATGESVTEGSVTEGSVRDEEVERLNERIRTALGRAAVPVEVRTLPAIPRLPNGKPDHRALSV